MSSQLSVPLLLFPIPIPYSGNEEKNSPENIGKQTWKKKQRARSFALMPKPLNESFQDRAAAGLGTDFSFQLLGRDCVPRAIYHILIQSFNIYDYCSVPDTACT